MYIFCTEGTYIVRGLVDIYFKVVVNKKGGRKIKRIQILSYKSETSTSLYYNCSHNIAYNILELIHYFALIL